MEIEECLNTTIDFDDRKINYSYRLTKRLFHSEDVYGIEVERQDIKFGKLVKIERDSIEVVSKNRAKANELLELLFNNEVSPIHLVDIISPYVEDGYVDEFIN